MNFLFLRLSCFATAVSGVLQPKLKINAQLLAAGLSPLRSLRGSSVVITQRLRMVCESNILSIILFSFVVGKVLEEIDVQVA